MTERIKAIIQTIGSVFSRVAFTERTLSHPSVRYCYKALYDTFKWLFERKEMKYLSGLARSGSTVMDIGANVGWTVACFSEAVGREGRVLAFEPDPVARNIGKSRTRNMANVAWFPYAIGATEGTIVFFQNLSLTRFYQPDELPAG